MAQGTVKWFDDSRGYGFIGRQDGPDVFVHSSQVVAPADEEEKRLQKGDRVEFQIDLGPRGPQAARVRRIHV